MKVNATAKFLPKALSKMFVVITLLFLSFSCDEGEETNMRKYGGQMTMTINGQARSMSNNSIYVNYGNFSFNSTSGDVGQIEIYIDKGIAKTTYQIQRNSVVFLYGKEPAEAGVITITEINEQAKTMSGTFEVTIPVSGTSDKIYIESGVFTNVPYVLQTEGGGELQTANIDGVAFRGYIGSVGSNYINFRSGYNILEISFPYTDAPIEYDVASFIEPYYGIKYVEGLYSYKATSGVITITSHDTNAGKLVGTFSAEVESIPVAGVTKQITDGTFSFTY